MAVLTIENEADFTAHVLHCRGLVLVDFWAPWCEPCKMVRSEIKRAAESTKNYASVVKVDVDKFPDLAERYEVMAVPTLLFFKDGQDVKRIIGYVTQGEIEKTLQEYTTEAINHG